MRILIGVIATEEPVYRMLENEALRKTWANPATLDDEVEVIYCYGGRNSLSLEGDRLYCPFPEVGESIILKTLEFFDFALKTRRFDYLLRTNLSSYWDLKNLKSFLLGKPGEGFFGAVPTYYGDREFGSGAGYLLTPDLLKLSLSNSCRLGPPYDCDDVALSFLFHDLGVRLTPAKRQDFQTVADVDYLNTSHYHFRCKSFDGSNRRTDCKIMERVHAIMLASHKEN